MKDINVLLLLTPKTELACINDDMNVRQAIEKMRAHSYTAVPVITKNGEYVGTITEGDLLWNLIDRESDLEELETVKVSEIVRKDYTPAVSVNANQNELIKMITAQNFVPIVDDRNILMGIVTRKRVIQAISEDEA